MDNLELAKQVLERSRKELLKEIVLSGQNGGTGRVQNYAPNLVNVCNAIKAIEEMEGKDKSDFAERMKAAKAAKAAAKAAV